MKITYTTWQKSVCVHGTSSNKVSKKGIEALDDKVEAITNAPAPMNVLELKSYLGMINYNQKFLPNLSSVSAPSQELLRKETH